MHQICGSNRTIHIKIDPPSRMLISCTFTNYIILALTARPAWNAHSYEGVLVDDNIDQCSIELQKMLVITALVKEL